jgi:hypothetical protein
VRKHRPEICFILIYLSLVAVAGATPVAPEAPSDAAAPMMAASQIVDHMVASNAGRADALKGYQGKRTYRLEYKGFPSAKSAEMKVEVTFSAGGAKQFRVVSESGSALLINKVLKKLIESEREASEESAQRNALTAANYTFTFDHAEEIAGRTHYVMNVEPLRNDKFLYRGRIWIDAQDFAVARIEAQPAKNPSFWIKKTEITHQYVKVGDFWLPASNHSESSTRLGGHAILTIEYTDYEIKAGSEVAVK